MTSVLHAKRFRTIFSRSNSLNNKELLFCYPTVWPKCDQRVSGFLPVTLGKMKHFWAINGLFVFSSMAHYSKRGRHVDRALSQAIHYFFQETEKRKENAVHPHLCRWLLYTNHIFFWAQVKRSRKSQIQNARDIPALLHEKIVVIFIEPDGHSFRFPDNIVYESVSPMWFNPVGCTIR